MSIYQELTERLKEIKRLEEKQEAKCDWADSDDVAEYRKQKNSLTRREILDKLVPDRKCPTCKMVRFTWVVKPDRAECASCFYKVVPIGVKLEIKIFSPVPRWKLDPRALMTARVQSNMSQTDFARLAGWTRSYQRNLEDGRQKTVSQEVAETILEALEEIGTKTLDVV